MTWKDVFPDENRYFETKNGILYCADSLDILKKFPPSSVDFVLTDPPYNINLKPQRAVDEDKFVSRDGIFGDDMTDEDFMRWLGEVFGLVNHVLKSDRYVVTFLSWKTTHLFYPVLNKYFDVRAMCVWVKDNYGIGYYVRPQYEPFYLCLKGNPKPPRKAPSDVWFYKKVYPKQGEKIHIAQKPVELLADILKYYSQRTDIILDPFLGSGSTAVACERMNLRWIGIEIDEENCETAKNRLEQWKKQGRLYSL